MSLRKTLTALGAIVFVEIAARISLIGVNAVVLNDYMTRNGKGGLLGLYALLAGGGLYRGSIAALGIMPYLTARINVRLLRVVFPALERKAHSERGRLQLRTLTRWMTAAFALTQSVGFAAFLRKVPGVVTDTGSFMTTTILTLTAGSLVAMWVGEQLTESDDAPDVAEIAELDSGSARPLALPTPDPATPREDTHGQVRQHRAR